MAEDARLHCCIVGGGPAGLVLGVLMARAGVRVAVLEKHADFLRDFRGDTIHPSTLEVMHELGWLEEFLRLPHERVDRLVGRIGGADVAIADFTHLPATCRFMALMPQWDFLNFLAAKGALYPGFRLHMSTEATGLVEESGRIVGASARSASGPVAFRAALVVAADGRGSLLRDRAGLEVQNLGAPIDALWFRISRKAGDPGQTMGRIDAGRILVMLDRGAYWQCAFVIAKGTVDQLKARGLASLREAVASLLPFEAERLDELKSWDDLKLLTVRVDRLGTWHRPGLLCIGDAAHAMSPIGGVGVNLAVQDAVAAANVLVPPLLAGTLTDAHLAAVQGRRSWPTRVTQAIQVTMQDRLIAPTLAAARPLTPPLAIRLMQTFPVLQRIPARIFGLGIRPEHVAPYIREGERPQGPS